MPKTSVMQQVERHQRDQQRRDGTDGEAAEQRERHDRADRQQRTEQGRGRNDRSPERRQALHGGRTDQEIFDEL